MEVGRRGAEAGRRFSAQLRRQQRRRNVGLGAAAAAGTATEWQQRCCWCLWALFCLHAGSAGGLETAGEVGRRPKHKQAAGPHLTLLSAQNVCAGSREFMEMAKKQACMNGKTAGTWIRPPPSLLVPSSARPSSMMPLRAAAPPLALAVLAALLGASSCLPAAQAAAPAPSQPTLALLFSANVTAACAGRCSLRPVAAACGSSTGAAAAAGETSGQLLSGWNSLSLDGGVAAALTATVTVSCSDPACAAQPRRFVAWRGAECGSDGSSGGLPALPARALPGLASGSSDRVYTLGGSQPALRVRYAPLQARAAVAAQPAPNSTVPSQLPTNASSAHAATPSSQQQEHCGRGRRHAALLKLALAVWTLGCAALGARL